MIKIFSEPTMQELASFPITITCDKCNSEIKILYDSVKFYDYTGLSGSLNFVCNCGVTELMKFD